MDIKEYNKDLFSSDSKNVLAHCISADCVMGAGIAKLFVDKNPNVKKFLRNKNPQVGDAIYFESSTGHSFYNLVTKELYYHKPTYSTLELSLERLKGNLLDKGQKNLAIPKIGCGLDNLDWNFVKNIVENKFNDTNIEIKVYYI